MNIYQRMNAVMKDVSYVQRESKKVNGQYTYASHDGVTAALRDPLIKHGIVLFPSVIELTQDGNKTIAKVQVSFINIDKPEEQVSVIHYGFGIDPSDKGVGKAVSYACKYAMLKTFCLETGDDPEKENIPYEPAKKEEEKDIDYADILSKEMARISKSCNAAEKTYVVGYMKALEDEFLGKDRGEESLYKLLKKFNGTIKERAYKWSIEQASKA